MDVIPPLFKRRLLSQNYRRVPETPARLSIKHVKFFIRLLLGQGRHALVKVGHGFIVYFRQFSQSLVEEGMSGDDFGGHVSSTGFVGDGTSSDAAGFAAYAGRSAGGGGSLSGVVFVVVVIATIGGADLK